MTRRGMPRPAWQLGAGAVLAGLAVLAAFVVAQSRNEKRRHDTQAVDAYERALRDPARRGGFVIQEGMKPAVSALGSGRTVPALLQAVGWVDQLEQVRVDFARASPPPRLRSAAGLFNEALQLYKEAAERIGASTATTEPAVRSSLLDQAVVTARRADAAYDKASALLQRERARVGLPPSAAFPQQESQ